MSAEGAPAGLVTSTEIVAVRAALSEASHAIESRDAVAGDELGAGSTGGAAPAEVGGGDGVSGPRPAQATTVIERLAVQNGCFILVFTGYSGIGVRSLYLAY